MKRLNKLYFTVSIIIESIATILVPTNPVQGNAILRYKYGFPLKYITIIQNETTSKWFGDNLFNGNMGLAIDPFIFLINVFILYYVILYSAKMCSKYLSKTKIR